MLDESEIATILIDHVERDTALPRRIRQEARSLRALVIDMPELALERLSRLAEEEAPVLSMMPPDTDLTRCVSLEVFHTHHISGEAAMRFPTVSEYRAHLQAIPHPDHRLMLDVDKTDPLIPRRFSWLVREDDVLGLDGSATCARLNFSQPPPLVLFHFSLAKMASAGVQVRLPVGLDAVPNRHTQWTPGGLPTGIPEFIDGDIPFRALERISFRE